MVLGLKGQRSRLGSWFELYEFLLVVAVLFGFCLVAVVAVACTY